MRKGITAIVLTLLIVTAIAAVGCTRPAEAKPSEKESEEITDSGEITKNSDGSIELPIIWG